MRNRTKAMTAAAVVAALTAGSTAAAASTTGATPGAHAKTVSANAKTVSASGKPAPANGKPAPANGKPAVDSGLAARLGVSPARLEQALRAVKISLSKATAKPTEDQFDATLAHILGIPQARVRQAFLAGKPGDAKQGDAKQGDAKQGDAKQGGAKSGGAKSAPRPDNEAFAATVGRELHLGTARVNAALQPMFAAGRADPLSPVFAAAARSLGVSTPQLAAAIMSAKQSMAGGN
jgi:hypothetical protein